MYLSKYKASRLPEGYTEVTYIQSSGTQYIDTGFVPDNNTRVVMDAQLTTSGSIAVWFGARTSATSNNYAFVRTSSGDTFRSDYNNVYTQTWTADDSVRYVVDKNAETTTFAGTTQSYTNAAFQCPCNMTLFALNQAGTIQWYAVMKLYSCQIYDNGILARDYVPCVDANGEAGLYDVANGVFYGNAGTGAFAVGESLITGNVARKVTQPYLVMGGMTKKVTQGYNVVNGFAKQFLSLAKPNPFESYSGVYTVQRLTVDSAPYILYTLTGSGKLVLKGPARVWMNGGGANGRQGSLTSGRAYGGDGGGGGFVTNGELSSGEYVVTIGARQGTTSFVHTDGTSLSAAGATSKNGASGGGAGNSATTSSTGNGTPGTGEGVTTYPFGITSLYAHSAGGGGGGVMRDSGEDGRGKAGGGGGSNGSAGTNTSTGTNGGTGGTRGGGKGGGSGSESKNGSAATFYGSGGGGAYQYNSTTYSVGSGYQGVAYLLIPDEGYELAA